MERLGRSLAYAFLIVVVGLFFWGWSSVPEEEEEYRSYSFFARVKSVEPALTSCNTENWGHDSPVIRVTLDREIDINVYPRKPIRTKTLEVMISDWNYLGAPFRDGQDYAEGVDWKQIIRNTGEEPRLWYYGRYAFESECPGVVLVSMLHWKKQYQ